MRILLIGAGGREHALARALTQSSKEVKLYAMPGNPGICSLAEKVGIDISNVKKIIDFVNEKQIDFVFIGPEQPIADGLSDGLRKAGIAVFAPSRDAAMLEISKGYAKDFMQRHKIPTAVYRRFKAREQRMAKAYLYDFERVVIKADGLAAGKGVIIPKYRGDAVKAIDEVFSGAFGEAGEELVIEEFMEGEEASIFVISDGSNYIILPACQDHKRIGNNDTGKNTGGMGAFAPARLVNEKVLKQIEDEIIKPTIKGMKDEGRPFVGCLFIGLMIKEDYAKVVEYNCRFGDPETEAVLSLIEGDFARLCLSAAKGNLEKDLISFKNEVACTVILASEGYPDKFEKDYEIKGIDKVEDGCIVYHCGTKDDNGRLATNGGRVLAVTALGKNLKEAQERAYNNVNKISFKNKYFRNDIGNKGIKYES